MLFLLDLSPCLCPLTLLPSSLHPSLPSLFLYLPLHLLYLHLYLPLHLVYLTAHLTILALLPRYLVPLLIYLLNQLRI